LLAGAFFAVCSVYLATRLLLARCEGFSCTYVGVAWLFWLGGFQLPAMLIGYFAQKNKGLSVRFRAAVRIAWLAHMLFGLGLLGWWLLNRA
jgi:hypothetical protein